jgi:hypothetical protein
VSTRQAHRCTGAVTAGERKCQALACLRVWRSRRVRRGGDGGGEPQR